MILSDSLFLVHTDFGSIVYLMPPQHLNDRPGTTLQSRCIEYGKQLAVLNNGQWQQWYQPGRKWRALTDARTIALLERVPDA